MTARASPAAASRFMLRCRHLSTTVDAAPPPARTTSNRTPSSSRYAPSNFGKPFTSEVPSPSLLIPNQPSNLPSHPVRNVLHVPAIADTYLPQSAGTISTKPRPAKTPARPFTIPPPARPPLTFLQRLGLLKRPDSSQIPADPFNVWNNPYRAHKTWPPNFPTLSHVQQLGFEKIYKRRVALKWARPQFKRWVTLIQNSLIAFIVFYAVFVYDAPQGTPFDGLRARIWGFVGESELFPERVREEAKGRQGWFGNKWERIKESFVEVVPQEGMVKGGDRRMVVDPEEWKVPWAQRRKRED